jgi:hypothetical protein
VNALVSDAISRGAKVLLRGDAQGPQRLLERSCGPSADQVGKAPAAASAAARASSIPALAARLATSPETGFCRKKGGCVGGGDIPIPDQKLHFGGCHCHVLFCAFTNRENPCAARLGPRFMGWTILLCFSARQIISGWREFSYTDWPDCAIFRR